MKDKLKARFPGFEVLVDDEPEPATPPGKLIRVERRGRARAGRVRETFQVTIRDGGRVFSRGGYGTDVESEVAATMAALAAERP